MKSKSSIMKQHKGHRKQKVNEVKSNRDSEEEQGFSQKLSKQQTKLKNEAFEEKSSQKQSASNLSAGKQFTSE